MICTPNLNLNMKNGHYPRRQIPLDLQSSLTRASGSGLRSWPWEETSHGFGKDGMWITLERERGGGILKLPGQLGIWLQWISRLSSCREEDLSYIWEWSGERRRGPYPKPIHVHMYVCMYVGRLGERKQYVEDQINQKEPTIFPPSLLLRE